MKERIYGGELREICIFRCLLWGEAENEGSWAVAYAA
jgi:hypothetical protein